MFFPDPTFFHPGSRIRTVSIPDTGSASKNLSIFNPKKWFLNSRKYDPGCSSRIPDPDADFYPSRIPDPGGQKGTGSRIQGSKRHQIPDPDPQHWLIGVADPDVILDLVFFHHGSRISNPRSNSNNRKGEGKNIFANVSSPDVRYLLT
jgi:hypothetical protein